MFTLLRTIGDSLPRSLDFHVLLRGSRSVWMQVRIPGTWRDHHKCVVWGGNQLDNDCCSLADALKLSFSSSCTILKMRPWLYVGHVAIRSLRSVPCFLKRTSSAARAYCVRHCYVIYIPWELLPGVDASFSQTDLLRFFCRYTYMLLWLGHRLLALSGDDGWNFLMWLGHSLLSLSVFRNWWYHAYDRYILSVHHHRTYDSRNLWCGDVRNCVPLAQVGQ